MEVRVENNRSAAGTFFGGLTCRTTAHSYSNKQASTASKKSLKSETFRSLETTVQALFVERKFPKTKA